MMSKFQLKNFGFVFIATALIFSSTNVNAKVRGPYDKNLKPALINSITGQVWGPNNVPVPNINVELMNELGSRIDQQRTSQSGLYSFSGISAGNFKVQVLTLGTDFLSETHDVQIINLMPTMSDQQYVDFHLKFNPKRVNQGSEGAADDIFVQEGITKEAEKRYGKAMSYQKDKKSDLAIAEFKEAIKLFPNYYQALNALGRELVEQKKYDASLDYLIRAIDLNQRSFTAFYALAYSCYQLNQIPPANEAARAAVVLKSSSLNAQLLYGKILRLSGNYSLSEQSLLKAKSIGSNKVAVVNWELALLYNRLKKNKQAAEELEAFLKNKPEAAEKKEVEELIAKLKTSDNVKFP